MPALIPLDPLIVERKHISIISYQAWILTENFITRTNVCILIVHHRLLDFWWSRDRIAGRNNSSPTMMKQANCPEGVPQPDVSVPLLTILGRERESKLLTAKPQSQYMMMICAHVCSKLLYRSLLGVSFNAP